MVLEIMDNKELQAYINGANYFGFDYYNLKDKTLDKNGPQVTK